MACLRAVCLAVLSSAGAGYFGVCGRMCSAGVGIGVAAAIGTPHAPCSPTVSSLCTRSFLCVQLSSVNLGHSVLICLLIIN